MGAAAPPPPQPLVARSATPRPPASTVNNAPSPVNTQSRQTRPVGTARTGPSATVEGSRSSDNYTSNLSTWPLHRPGAVTVHVPATRRRHRDQALHPPPGWPPTPRLGVATRLEAPDTCPPPPPVAIAPTPTSGPTNPKKTPHRIGDGRTGSPTPTVGIVGLFALVGLTAAFREPSYSELPPSWLDSSGCSGHGGWKFQPESRRGSSPDQASRC